MMIVSHAMLAEFDFVRALGPALAVAVVPIVLSFLLRSAHKESIAFVGSRSVGYTKAMRVFAVLGWGLPVLVSVLVGLTAKDARILTAVLAAVPFVALILPLYLEVFWVSITWDDANIYTRSPWRRRRTIPFSAVKSCDYSTSMQWYRIHTDGYGIVRLHSLMRGIPDLLRALPCSTPPYPPNTRLR